MAQMPIPDCLVRGYCWLRSAIGIFALSGLAFLFLPSQFAIGQDRPQNLQVEVVDENGSPIEVARLPQHVPNRRESLRKGLEQVLATGRFETAEAEVVGNTLRIQVRRLSKLARIDLVFDEGAKISSERILRAISVARGSTIARDNLEQIQEDTKTELMAQGFPNAKVSASLRPTKRRHSLVLRIELTKLEPVRIEKVHTNFSVPQGWQDQLPTQGTIADREKIELLLEGLENDLRQADYLEADLAPPRYKKTPTGGLDLYLEGTVGKPYRILFNINAPFTRDEIAEELNVREQALNPYRIKLLQKKLRTFIASEGFAKNRVLLDTMKEANRSILRVTVDVGKPVKIRTIKVHGADTLGQDFIASQFRLEINRLIPERFLQPIGYSAPLLSKERDRRRLARTNAELYRPPLFDDAQKALQEELRAEGFLQGQVSSRVEWVGAATIIFHLDIKEGPRSRISSIRIRGNTLIDSRRLSELLDLRLRDTLSARAVDDSAETITDFYRSLGYYFARTNSSIHLSEDQWNAEVLFEIVEGPRTRISDVDVIGESITRESLIKAASQLRPGQVITPELLENAQNRVTELGQFRGVRIDVQDAGFREANKVILITVSERPRQLFDVGASISTGQGARVDLEYTYRNALGLAIDCSIRATVAWQFFFFDSVVEERYERLSVLDRLERQLGGSCTLPYVGIPDFQINFGVRNQRENERNFGLDNNQVDLTFIYNPRNWFSASLSSDLEMNEVTLLVDDDNYESLIQNTNDPRLRRLLRVPEGQTSLGALELRLAGDFRDSPFDPTRGAFISIANEWAHTIESEEVESGGELRSFFSHHLRTQLVLGGYIPIGASVVLALQAKGGRIFHLDDRSQTYPNRKFFLGGASTIRGYIQDSMIPQDIAEGLLEEGRFDSAALIQGGDTFLVLRSELRFPILSLLRGGIFFELGNLWADPNLANYLDLRPTLGVGLRLQTPLGPIAFDYGFLLARRTDLAEPVGAFHFSVGLF